MRTLRKEPGKPWEIVEVPNELEALQKAVGGHLERVTFASDICVLCDKEALCKGLPLEDLWEMGALRRGDL